MRKSSIYSVKFYLAKMQKTLNLKESAPSIINSHGAFKIRNKKLFLTLSYFQSVKVGDLLYRLFHLVIKMSDLNV